MTLREQLKALLREALAEVEKDNTNLERLDELLEQASSKVTTLLLSSEEL